MKLIKVDLKAILRFSERSKTPGCSTGWKSVDNHYTVASHQLTVITGVPSHGKSEWLDALMVNLLDTSPGGRPWRFLICSPENFPAESHAVKLLEKMAGVGFNDIDPATLNRLYRKLEAHFDWLELEDNDGYKDVLIQANDFAARNSNNAQVGIVLDPWNQLEHNRPAHWSESEYISAALAAAIKITRTHGAHMWIVAHPQKMLRDKDTGKRPVPTPYDISGSANWYNKPDNILTVWRDVFTQDESNAVQVHVQKVRFKRIGRPGLVELRYDWRCGRYVEQ